MELPEKILKVIFIIVFMIFCLYLIQNLTDEFEKSKSQKPAKPNPAKELLVRDVNRIYSLLKGNRRKVDRQHQNDEISNRTYYSSKGISNNPGNEQGDYEENFLPLILPVDGDISISSGFGTRTDPFTGRNIFHNGIDIPLPAGTPVRSTGNGFVARTGYSSLLGKFITIKHGNSYQTIYGHLSSFSVQSGQNVQMGEIIGKSGNTGRSTNPHLHYQINYKGKPEDPMLIKQALNVK